MVWQLAYTAKAGSGWRRVTRRTASFRDLLSMLTHAGGISRLLWSPPGLLKPTRPFKLRARRPVATAVARRRSKGLPGVLGTTTRWRCGDSAPAACGTGEGNMAGPSRMPARADRRALRPSQLPRVASHTDASFRG